MTSPFKLLVLAFCILASGALAFAQGASDEPEIVPSDSSGEITSREIDQMSMEVKGRRERLFIIARLGTGETSRRLNRGRLYNTRQYLSLKAFDPLTTVFAEGERVEGEGRIEFYLGGTLRLVTLAKRNKMPNLTCCEDYFPVVRRRLKKSRSGNR
jgi:hypothetical protein